MAFIVCSWKSESPGLAERSSLTVRHVFLKAEKIYIPISFSPVPGIVPTLSWGGGKSGCRKAAKNLLS